MKKPTIHTIFDSCYDEDAFKEAAEEWAACENEDIEDEEQKVSAKDYPPLNIIKRILLIGQMMNALTLMKRG